MHSSLRLLHLAAACWLFLAANLSAEEPLPPIPPIKRLLPPEGIKLPDEVKSELMARVDTIRHRLKPLREDEKAQAYVPDVEIFAKAIDFALRFNEFYDEKKDVAKANKLLDEAERRLSELVKDRHTWTMAAKLVVRGYRSRIDDSVQPYGVVFPEGFDANREEPYPVYIWLHGRGDKTTDLHFIYERMTQVGQLGEVDGIVVHPFGRHCVGFKSAGEVDVADAWQMVALLAEQERPPLATGAPLLVGFSMGGAGAWHIGAHDPHFLAVAPGAGFAETALYTRTDPLSVPWYQRKLWALYDVPCYTRNLFNTQVIAYSGEKDKQIQAARVMEEAFRSEGRELTHLIGPGVEHKYEPKTLEILKAKLDETVGDASRLSERSEFHLQTRTLRYSNVHWLAAQGLERHWDDARIDATVAKEDRGEICTLKTHGVTAFALLRGGFHRCLIDGVPFEIPKKKRTLWLLFERQQGAWQEVERLSGTLRKRPRLQGPIDDAFLDPFIVVTPSGKSKHPLVERWVQFELQHFIERWAALMRGNVRVKRDIDITQKDIDRFHLVCFGDADSNQMIGRAAEKLPVGWRDGKIVAGEQSWSANEHLPVLIYPNPLCEGDLTLKIHGGNRMPRYIVINSGLTFREAHDRTNSQQNPKLPDWAVIDLTQVPDDKSPGRIAAAGFFDEQWQYQPPPNE